MVAGAKPAAPTRIRRKKRRHGLHEEEDGFSKGGARKRHRGSKKKARLVAIISIIWIVLIAGTAVTMRMLNPEKREEPFVQPAAIQKVSDEDMTLVREAKGEVQQEYSRFISDSNPSSRSSHVLRGPENLAGMIKASGSSSELAYTGNSEISFPKIVNTPLGKGMVFLISWDAGQKVEIPFFREEGHWKIDWRDYARYSPASTEWSLFLAGGGDETGEYRVFIRQRAETGFVPPNQMAVSLSLAKFGKPDETTNSSPPIILDRDSEIGIRLQKSFDAREKGVDIFGNKLVEHDPDGQVRIRAKVSRQIDGDKKVFKIEELLASHWFDCGDEPAADAAAAKP